MADNKVFIPASSGGVVTYYNDIKTKLEFDPRYVIVAIVVVLILEFILHRSSLFLG
ncbi:preprotein translocase subunit Sec61beta [Candidatus Woesearchaeota archaeon]|nr:preprotein translocase subunit Sec61beta [Candidatus Woesearchaeota archaeon]